MQELSVDIKLYIKSTTNSEKLPWVRLKHLGILVVIEMNIRRIKKKTEF